MRKIFRIPGAIALVLAFCAGAAFAQAYPNRPITLIVPWPAGGSTDLSVRAIADIAAKHLGQRFVIENRAGATGTVGPTATRSPRCRSRCSACRT
jgi:tripartite-type tricarboxylate transporter receptor subunit TctC